MHETVTKDIKAWNFEAPRRGRRLEVKILPKTLANCTGEQMPLALTSIGAYDSSRLSGRNVELEGAEIGGGGVVNGGSVEGFDVIIEGENEEMEDEMEKKMNCDIQEDDEHQSNSISCIQTQPLRSFNNYDYNNFQSDHHAIDNTNCQSDKKLNTDVIEKADEDQMESGSQHAHISDPSYPPNEDTPLKVSNDVQSLSPKERNKLIWEARKRTMIDYLKKFLGFLLSTVGLFILLFSYTILGGIIFHEIESPNEMITKSGVKASLKFTVEMLWNSTMQLNVLNEKQWSIMAMGILENYTTVVYRATKNDGWDGKDDKEADLQWSFAGSLLYCVTVITTIGYGHIAPKTNLGRLVTIFYAIFGIPLCLLSITHVGGFMATVFRFLYKNIFCGLCCFCCNKIKNRKLVREKPSIGKLEKNTENCARKNSACCVCCVPKRKEEGTPSREGLLATQTPRRRVPKPVLPISKESASRRLRQSYKTIVKWRRGIRNALFTDDNKNIQVPIYVSLLLIGGYIAIGAMIFGLWEDEWNFLIGSYFCFITLSTIGFGDFVPGTSLNPSGTQGKLVICTLYLIIGLALLAMCFDLMQEEARSFFKNIGKQLGLLDEAGGEEGKSGGSGSGGSEVVNNAELTSSV